MLGAAVVVGLDSRMAMRVVVGPKLVEVLKQEVGGSGCRVRVGVVERGGVLECLWRGVPPIGEGKS